MKRRTVLEFGLAAPALAAPMIVRAQTRILRLVAPYPPGGGIDAQARAIAGPLGTAIGRNVIVENRGGGNTRIGTDAVRGAPPDGSMLLLMPAVAWVGFVVSGSFDYDPWKTLVPVAQIAETPYNFLQTRSGSGLDSWEKVRQYARSTPEGLKVGGPSAGGIIEYTVDDLFRRGGIKGLYVPFKGAAQAHTALLGRTIDMQILTFGDGMGNVAAGATHPIAVSSARRDRRAPNVPTFAELGIGETLMNAFSLWAAPATPAQIVAELAAGLRAAGEDAAFRTFMEERLAFNVVYKDAAAVAADLAAIERDWTPRLRAAK